MRRTAAERFWAKVDKSGDCWAWTAAMTGRINNYGSFWCNGRLVRAHRWSYQQAKGPIPDGLQIDHTCRNPPCVNPDHLEAVTQSENLRRGHWPNSKKTHCPQGHPYSGDNLRLVQQGGRLPARRCRKCDRAIRARLRARRRTDTATPKVAGGGQRR